MFFKSAKKKIRTAAPPGSRNDMESYQEPDVELVLASSICSTPPSTSR